MALLVDQSLDIIRHQDQAIPGKEKRIDLMATRTHATPKSLSLCYGRNMAPAQAWAAIISVIRPLDRADRSQAQQDQRI